MSRIEFDRQLSHILIAELSRYLGRKLELEEQMTAARFLIACGRKSSWLAFTLFNSAQSEADLRSRQASRVLPKQG